MRDSENDNVSFAVRGASEHSPGIKNSEDELSINLGGSSRYSETKSRLASMKSRLESMRAMPIIEEELVDSADAHRHREDNNEVDEN